MKIIRKEIERSGRSIHVAWIDTEGLNLGIDTISSGDIDEDQVPESEFVAVREIDKRNSTVNDEDEDLSIELTDEDLQPVLTQSGILDLNKVYFCIDTYKKLATDPHEIWEILLKPANGFLAHLSDEDSKLLCLFYIDVRKIIDEELIILKGNLSDVSITIGNLLYDLSAKIDLPAKLIYYCKNYDIPVPSLDYAGTRIGQDREEMTFREPEYYLIMAVTILCKLLCPIWGDLIFRTIKDIDTMQKETHCVGVITPILGTPLFDGVMQKLYKYISNIVDKAMSSSYTNASFTATIGGFSKTRFHQSVYAMVIVKRYVNVDLYTPISPGVPGNLMTWTSTCSKQSFTSLLQTLNNKCNVMKRIDISDKPDRGDEESNVSVLEHSSKVTSVTADVPILIKYGVQQAIKIICREYQVSELDLRTSMVYYHQNPIQVTFLNKILVGILLGNKMGGARGLKYLDHIDYTKLVVITQLYTANNIHSSLIHLLTATTPYLIDPNPQHQKTASNTIDNRISMLFAQSGEYRDCERAFPYPIDNISIGGILLKIKEHITKFNHFANTAPNVSAIMEEDPIIKGSLIEYDEMVIRNFCGMILQILVKEKHTFIGV